VDARRLSAAADQRIDRTNENMVRRDNRVGNFLDYDVFESFAKELFH